jgi:EpsI family protein
MDKKLIVLTVMFAVASFFVYRGTDQVTIDKKATLLESLLPLEGYRDTLVLPLDESTEQFLKLDDYLFARYVGSGVPVTLFIGYYFSSAKISAAHSPLVCFPSQGWEVDTPVMNQFVGDGYVVNYAEIEASQNERKDLVLYWYQAGEKTSPHIFMNKINSFSNNFLHNDEQHAFVRVTVPLAGLTQSQAHQQAENFIKAFYPQFTKYIGSANTLKVSIVE